MDRSPLMMILKMTAATVLYIAATALAFRFWRKRKHTMGLKLAVGLFFGLCSVASNHLGIDYGTMNLNVRDIGPLSAGLFFHPVSGILAGLIGGVERWVIGEYLNIGAFTRVACGVSTGLAGFLAAGLYRWIYGGERPTVVHAFMVGAVMEVFHMYAVLLTNRSDISMAYYIISVCAIPMIIFTAVGMAGCSLAVLWMTPDRRKTRIFEPLEKTPLFVHFQRRLLVVIVALFAFSTYIGYSIQVQVALESAYASMEAAMEAVHYEYTKQGYSMEEVRAWLRNRQDYSASYMCVIGDKENKKAIWEVDGNTILLPLTDKDLAAFEEHEGERPFRHVFSFMYESETFNLCREFTDRYEIIILGITATLLSGSEVQLYDTIFSNILIFSILYMLVSIMMNNAVVKNLKRVNQSLNRITDGELEETVSVRSSLELSELSDDINKTVTALRGYIDEAKKRMEKDLKLASDIQEAMLPRDFVFNRDDFEVYALMDPAKEVGGDFYDFFFIDNDLLALVIADVSGKSVPAAMFMMRAKTAIKNFARSGNSPAELLFKVNNTLCEGNDAEMFVTVWLGIIDLKTGEMHCSNAGHEYPVIMRAGGDYELLKDRHGLALAAMEDARMQEYNLKLNPGDRLFVYTDGVPEAINEAEEAYGTENLTVKLNTMKSASEEETLRAVLQDVQAFAGRAEQFDDITMIGFSYRGENGGPSGML